MMAVYHVAVVVLKVMFDACLVRMLDDEYDRLVSVQNVVG